MSIAKQTVLVALLTVGVNMIANGAVDDIFIEQVIGGGSLGLFVAVWNWQ